MLIALSLSLAPVAQAWAAVPAVIASEMTMMGGDDGAAMDCAKMGMAAAAKGEKGSECPCCDTKSKCPDMSACLLKCSSHVIGVLPVPLKVAMVALRLGVPTEPEAPPDWSLRPPAPPPRS